SEFNCFTLTGLELDRIIRRHFRSSLLGVYGGLISANQVFVESVFDVGCAILAIEQAGKVGLVLREEQIGLARAEKPAFAVPPMLNLSANASGNTRCFLCARPPQILAPRPCVAKPQRKEKMYRGRLGPAIYSCDFDENVLNV